MDSKISATVAQQQLDELLDYYEIDGESFIDENQSNIFSQTCERLKKAIMRGRLSISGKDGIEVKQHLKNSYAGEVKVLDYAELAGKHKTSMGKHKDTDHYGRMYALLGSLTGMGEVAITKLKGPDLSTAECLGFLFLQV
jgi:hypothetical protein